MSTGGKEFEELAIKWAGKPSETAISKKLWLRIALSFIEDDQKIRQLLKTPGCQLRIADLLPYLKDEKQIVSYKQLIEENLKEYNSNVMEYNRRLQKY